MKPIGPQYVITCDRPLSEEQAAHLRAVWEREYSGKVLVLPRGMSIRSGSLREWLACHTRGMTMRRWQREVPAVYVAVAELLPIQPEPDDPERGHLDVVPRRDNAAHVVEIDGRLYIEDGHHRYYRARRAGNPWLLVRVLHAGGTSL